MNCPACLDSNSRLIDCGSNTYECLDPSCGYEFEVIQQSFTNTKEVKEW